MKPRLQLAIALLTLFGMAPATRAAEAEDAQARVAALEAQAEGWQYAGQLARAEAGFRAALEAGTAGDPAGGESLQVAGTLSRLGNVVRLQGRFDEAARIHERALAIRERLAPDSLEVTDSLHQLVLVAWERKDLGTMEALIRRAMAIQERFPPDTLAMADTLSDLGLLASEEGRYAEAAAHMERSLAILERRAPDSIPLATSLARLALINRAIGELEAAEERLRRALAIRDRLAPESLGIASILTNLGDLARERGDLDEAARHIERAVAVAEKAAPKSNAVTAGLNALGAVERMRGNLDKAWEHHQRALKVREQHAGRSEEVGYILGLLGNVAEARGDLSAALDLYQQALAAIERQSPGGVQEAHALRDLGLLHRRMGHPDQAAQILTRAVDTLESWSVRIGGTRDLQASFRARHEGVYLDAIETELARGNAPAAFHLLERYKARSFLTLLAERDLAFGELPEALERSRQDVAARYDRKLRELSQANEEAKAALQLELDRLRQERDDVAEKIRAAAPRLAALREPRPLGFEVARRFLDPGTLALSYSVGKDRTVLFAITRDGSLQAKTLPLGRERLRREVESFLEKIRSQRAPADVAASAADLYRELIGPVADLVERSERLLILPDGPLHRLPFGALVREPRDGGRFLIEDKPLHTALSLTVYGTLRAAPAARGPMKLVAFGDPRFPKGTQAKSDLAPGLRGFDWSSLPYSRSEVERIAVIYPEARLYLGEEATEERAKSIREARILHFATHGYTNDRTPLDSALVLTVPEELSPGLDNGLLQVWEIFEDVRLDADLVVLSACESALGRELSGEGLIGLTRAFQYAGARSVVASLWSVADQVTAELMARFHRHLAAGLAKDEALRAAQLELIREPVRITTAKGQAIETDASAPFYWAAFQLFGDGR